MKHPYIVIGMHRSGTSLVAQVLHQAGIFMGVLKDHNHEAMHFLSCNQHSLWADGHNWLDPAVPQQTHWTTPSAKTLYIEHFKLNTRIQRIRYLSLPKDWGWKDPRNTFTLPMWLRLFPKAKVIYVKRNTTDIARSLQQRNQRAGEVQDDRLNDFDFCLQLAETYQTQASSYAASLTERFIEVEYEALTALDDKRIQALERFTGKQLHQHFKVLVR
jgi:hypothetical protein